MSFQMLTVFKIPEFILLRADIMNFICGLVSNYGLAIIIFTILVKLLLIPLTIVYIAYYIYIFYI